MYKCDLCHQNVEKWQSWHATGERLVHFACEVGKKPAATAQANYHSGEKARMTLGDEGISPKKKEGVEPPLGEGVRGNHRTKHTKNINGHARQYKVKKEEFDEDVDIQVPHLRG